MDLTENAALGRRSAVLLDFGNGVVHKAEKASIDIGKDVQATVLELAAKGNFKRLVDVGKIRGHFGVFVQDNGSRMSQEQTSSVHGVVWGNPEYKVRN